MRKITLLSILMAFILGLPTASAYTYEDNFDNSAEYTSGVPAGWVSTGDYRFARETGSYFGISAHSGDYVFATSGSSYGGRNEVFYTHMIPMTAGENYTLSFYLYMPQGMPASVRYNRIIVSAGPTQTSDSHTQLFSTQEACPEWTEHNCSFTPETDGEYCFMFKVESPMNNAGVIAFDDFKITTEEGGGGSVETTIEPPYAINFAESQEGWTTIDNSVTPGKTWTYNDRGFYYQGQYYPCVTMPIEYSSLYDDWYVSPAIQLTAGTYAVKTLAFKSASGPTTSIQIGTSATDASQFTKIADLLLPDTPNMEAYETNYVTIEADGVYYFAFHGTTAQRYNSAAACLFEFSVESGEKPIEPDQPVMGTLPYNIDFTGNHEGWTIADNNNDGVSWQFYETFGAYIYYFNEANDDLISPAFAMDAEKEYKITLNANGNFDNSTAKWELVAGTAGNGFTFVKELQIPKGGDVAEETIFTPATTGNYQFALRLTVEAATGYEYPFYVTDFAIAEHEGEEPPVDPEEPDPDKPEIGVPVYTDDFDRENPMEGWTAIDLNDDANTWKNDLNQQGISFDGLFHAANDMLISPAIKVVADQDYLINYSLSQVSAFDEDIIEIKTGDAATAEAMTTLLGTEKIYEDEGQGAVSGSQRLSTNKSGNVFIAFHILTASENGCVTLTHFDVTPISKATPTAVTDLVASSNFKEKSVTLTWVNPALDTDGTPINSSLSANIYENGTLIQSITQLNAGESCTYTYNPANFTGDVTYTVKAALNSNESEGTSTTINLDDIQGGLVLVKSFIHPDDVVDPNEWVMENLAGTSEFHFYNYFHSFDLDYKLGQKHEDDWVISPAIALEEDKRYIAKYQLKSSMSYGCDFDITIGIEQNHTAQNIVLMSHKNLCQNGYGDYETPQFTIPATGNYYVGFHTTNVNTSVSVRNLAIYYIDSDLSGVDELKEVSTLAYNRASSMLRVAENCESVILFDAQGRWVYSASVADTEVDLSGIPSGLYIVKAYNSNGTTDTLKFVK